MDLAELPLPQEIWAATPGAARALILALQARVRELETRLGQNSSNSSRPPSSDPPQSPARSKASSSGRKRGGQPEHLAAFRALLPVEQVDAYDQAPSCWRKAKVSPSTQPSAILPPRSRKMATPS